jgi:hypothetical protein
MDLPIDSKLTAIGFTLLRTPAHSDQESLPDSERGSSGRNNGCIAACKREPKAKDQSSPLIASRELVASDQIRDQKEEQ